MTIIQPKPELKIVALPVASDLSAVPLASAISLASVYPNDGWADLVVHQAELRHALRVANDYNAKNPHIQVRVITDTTLGREDWKVKTSGVIVTNLWTNKHG